eukprot:TRINITY_DN33959_c0_g1_i1.p1 TRINITY_DN33959_c0_g1~~TRINITY_DN33959_c0_g1_i1.p1  ORF type:complete len:378 (+),score=110.88 TRINITY_DN33959_c0_g1_i1:44-1177(+)
MAYMQQAQNCQQANWEQDCLPLNEPFSGHGSELIRRLPQPDDNDEKKSGNVVAVVVTINGGGSYDPLFSEQPQVVPEGVVRVYKSSFEALPVLRRYLTEDPTEKAALPTTPDTAALGVIDELLENMTTVGGEAVVFNFECCGGCSDVGFPDTNEVFRFTKTVLDKKCMVMFSDFSLKGLIGKWDAALLGPCPFEKVGELNSEMDIRFDVEKLKSEDCPSAQLTKVAELCKDGKAKVKAMGGTIMYSLKGGKAPPESAPYKLDILTVVTAVDGNGLKVPKESHVTSGGHTGILGHTSLCYPSGGILFTSSGHWISLAHLDTSQENLKNAVISQMGAENYSSWEKQYVSAPASQKFGMMQQKAAECVWQSAPCKSKSNY